MKKYENMDNFNSREHIVELTLQSGEFKGTLKQKITGNCLGQDILYCLDVENIMVGEKWPENNFNLEIEEDEDGEVWFNCTLKDDEGNECEIQEPIEDLKRMVVKLEIVDCEIIKD